MKTDPTPTQTVNSYIAGFPPAIQKLLKQVRRTIKAAAPDAEETIKYQIPTYVLKGNLVSFAAYKTHLGLYPIPAGTQKFQKQIAKYKAAKSSVRLPLDQPIPLDLISELVKYRVKENLAKAKAKERK